MDDSVIHKKNYFVLVNHLFFRLITYSGWDISFLSSFPATPHPHPRLSVSVSVSLSLCYRLDDSLRCNARILNCYIVTCLINIAFINIAFFSISYWLVVVFLLKKITLRINYFAVFNSIYVFIYLVVCLFLDRKIALVFVEHHFFFFFFFCFFLLLMFFRLFCFNVFLLLLFSLFLSYLLLFTILFRNSFVLCM